MERRKLQPAYPTVQVMASRAARDDLTANAMPAIQAANGMMRLPTSPNRNRWNSVTAQKNYFRRAYNYADLVTVDGCILGVLHQLFAARMRMRRIRHGTL